MHVAQAPDVIYFSYIKIYNVRRLWHVVSFERGGADISGSLTSKMGI